MPYPHKSYPYTRRPHTSTLFPYTTLFRSAVQSSEKSRFLKTANIDGAAGTDAAVIGPPAARRAEPSLVTPVDPDDRSEEHTSELQSRRDLVCRLLLEKKNVPVHLPHQTYL